MSYCSEISFYLMLFYELCIFLFKDFDVSSIYWKNVYPFDI